VSLKYDIQCDNFDEFFNLQVAKASENQRALLSKELLSNLYLFSGKARMDKIRKMNFFSKMFVLFKMLKKRCIIIVEDEVNGMNEEAFFKWKKMLHKQEYTTGSSDELITQASFTLGNKELVDTFHRINGLSVSNAYSYMIGSKNKSPKAKTSWQDNMDYIFRFLCHYEGNRKRISMQTGLNMPEWLVLIYLYKGEWTQGKAMYQERYKYSFNTNARSIRSAFGSLRASGYIEKVGETVNAKLRITALGRDKVNEIAQKFIVNC
jgi:hypothetical protein